MTGAMQLDLLHGARRARDGDAVAEPEGLCERNQDARDEVGQGRLRREADDERDHRRRGEDAPGDGADRRDHEQRAEHPDADDDSEDAARGTR